MSLLYTFTIKKFCCGWAGTALLSLTHNQNSCTMFLGGGGDYISVSLSLSYCPVGWVLIETPALKVAESLYCRLSSENVMVTARVILLLPGNSPQVQDR